ARTSTPSLSERRASSLNSSILATVSTPWQYYVRVRPASLSDDSQNVLLGKDEVVDIFELELGAGVLGEEDFVANLHIERDAVAIIVAAALTGGDDGAPLRLFLRGVWQHDATGRGFLAAGWLDHKAIAERLEIGNRI